MRSLIVGIMAKGKQYTLRGIPEKTDATLRKWSRQTGESLNEIAVRILNQAADRDSSQESPRFHDLNALAGTWIPDPDFDQAVQMFEEIDSDLWK